MGTFQTPLKSLQESYRAMCLHLSSSSLWLTSCFKKAISDVDLGVITHPRRSRRYPAKRLNDLDFADGIALLESTMSHAQAQLTKQRLQRKTLA